MGDVECDFGDVDCGDCNCDCDCGDMDCDCDCGDCGDCGCDCGCCHAFDCGNLCLGDSNNNIIFCCFPGRTNNAIRPNRTKTSPDVSLCCCCFLGESSYPLTSLPNRVSQQDQKRDGFCARVRKFFSRKQSSDQSMSSNPPPGKIDVIPHPSGDYPMYGRYNPYPFPAEKYPMHDLRPLTSIHEIPPRNHLMDSVYSPFRRQEVYPPRNRPAEGIYPSRNHPMDSVFPPFHKQEVHPARNHPAEVIYPPTKMPEFSRNQMEDHYPPTKKPEVPPRNHHMEGVYPPTKNGGTSWQQFENRWIWSC